MVLQNEDKIFTQLDCVKFMVINVNNFLIQIRLNSILMIKSHRQHSND